MTNSAIKNFFSTFWISLQNPQSLVFKGVLLCWHLLFVLVAWNDRVKRGISDAHFYWAENHTIADKSWFSFFYYGSDLLVFFNYPFIKLGVPFWWGFLLYGILGYFAILKFVEWISLLFGTRFQVGSFNILLLLFFWPNLHYWTAVLGKEPLVFWSLVVLFLGITKQQFRNFSFWIAVLVLFAIRPHVGLLLLVAGTTAYLITGKESLFSKAKKAFLLIPIGLLLFYMVLQLSKIRYFNWDRILRFNRGSLVSFDDSGSYVPMETYTVFYRVVSFFFRPFLWEAYDFKTLLVGVDNLIYLLFHAVAIGLLICNFSKLKALQLPMWFYTAVIFTLLCGFIFIFRYANLGIFMRTKIMYAPFMAVALLWIMREIKNVNKS
ncbi:hypothetical protein [Flavobacterium sp.]|uniref:hypothetical protein n=1 Tax=Flavobacterium sp. TaxID=239 RepID=UPI002632070D|nr:hypothetical protein [Flavobacterium sp.]MDD2985964.1 hypothetical protein [Flavobacterium sp.]